MIIKDPTCRVNVSLKKKKKKIVSHKKVPVVSVI